MISSRERDFLPQPRLDTLRLQRLIHDPRQFRSQRIHIRLILRGERELRQHLLGVVLLAVEAPIDDRLDAAAQSPLAIARCQPARRPAPVRGSRCQSRPAPTAWSAPCASAGRPALRPRWQSLTRQAATTAHERTPPSGAPAASVWLHQVGGSQPSSLPSIAQRLQ